MTVQLDPLAPVTNLPCAQLPGGTLPALVAKLGVPCRDATLDTLAKQQVFPSAYPLNKIRFQSGRIAG